MILNLTQHAATAAQIADGCIDLPDLERSVLVDALTFNGLPAPGEIQARAETIAQIAAHNGLGGDDGDDPHPTRAMIGGAPYLMSALESALLSMGVRPVYAFSVRKSVERADPASGSVTKTAVFEHGGWVAV